MRPNHSHHPRYYKIKEKKGKKKREKVSSDLEFWYTGDNHGGHPDSIRTLTRKHEPGAKKNQEGRHKIK